MGEFDSQDCSASPTILHLESSLLPLSNFTFSELPFFLDKFPLFLDCALFACVRFPFLPACRSSACDIILQRERILLPLRQLRPAWVLPLPQMCCPARLGCVAKPVVFAVIFQHLSIATSWILVWIKLFQNHQTQMQFLSDISRSCASWNPPFFPTAPRPLLAKVQWGPESAGGTAHGFLGLETAIESGDSLRHRSAGDRGQQNCSP